MTLHCQIKPLASNCSPSTLQPPPPHFFHSLYPNLAHFPLSFSYTTSLLLCCSLPHSIFSLRQNKHSTPPVHRKTRMRMNKTHKHKYTRSCFSVRTEGVQARRSVSRAFTSGVLNFARLSVSTLWCFACLCVRTAAVTQHSTAVPPTPTSPQQPPRAESCGCGAHTER